MDFIALSLEIADEQTQDICGIEIVEVKSRRIIVQKKWVIQPISLYISPLCVKQYQLKLSNLIDAPTLLEIWPQILSYLQDKLLFYHKAVWMVPILQKALDYYQLDFPTCSIGCTLMMSKKVYPQLNQHKLNKLASTLNLHQMNAIAPKASNAAWTAQLLLHIASTLGAFNLHELLEASHLTLGYFAPSATQRLVLPTFDEKISYISISDESFSRKTADTTDTPSSWVTVSTSLNTIPYNFQDKIVVLTGPLETMTRVDAVKKLNTLGATHSGSVTAKTQVVLTNIKNPDQLPLDALTSKLRRALILKAQGQPIDIIDEETFLQAIHYSKQ